MSSLSTVAGAAALGAYATVRHGRPLRRAGRAGEVERIAVRRMKAVAFRLQGATFRQIGAALGVGRLRAALRSSTSGSTRHPEMRIRTTAGRDSVSSG